MSAEAAITPSLRNDDWIRLGLARYDETMAMDVGRIERGVFDVCSPKPARMPNIEMLWFAGRPRRRHLHDSAGEECAGKREGL